MKVHFCNHPENSVAQFVSSLVDLFLPLKPPRWRSQSFRQESEWSLCPPLCNHPVFVITTGGDTCCDNEESTVITTAMAMVGKGRRVTSLLLLWYSTQT